MSTRLVLIHALSPLHPGTGQAVGAIDLPIARERPTGVPLLPGSSLKGALRARDASPLRQVVFGPETRDASDHAGAVQFADAHLVLLPVRSLAGTFAWATSPYLLTRLARDAREAGLELETAPTVPSIERCGVLSEKLSARLGNERRVVLEDLDFAPDLEPEPKGKKGPLRRLAAALAQALFPGDGACEQAGRESVSGRICLLHDDAMSYLLETATEVVARVRLDEGKKTVAKGALWYEESLPGESVLVGLAVGSDVKRNGTAHGADALLDHVAKVAGGLVQLGGKSTVGRGSCRVTLARGGRGGQP
jgi:CRISPR-associated protein Cmr4